MQEESEHYSKLARMLFEEKAKWHGRRARMSFTRKVEELDKMFERERLSWGKKRRNGDRVV